MLDPNTNWRDALSAVAAILSLFASGVRLGDRCRPCRGLTSPVTGSYSASKAAAWSFTGSAGPSCRGQGTQVVRVHLGYMDTDMVPLDVPKIAPADVARQILDAVESGAVLADLPSERAKAALSGAPAGLEL